MNDELTCQQVARLISDGLDAGLPPPERARLRMHFVVCEACRNLNQQMAFLRQALRGPGQRDQADSGSRDTPATIGRSSAGKRTAA